MAESTTLTPSEHDQHQDFDLESAIDSVTEDEIDASAAQVRKVLDEASFRQMNMVAFD